MTKRLMMTAVLCACALMTAGVALALDMPGMKMGGGSGKKADVSGMASRSALMSTRVFVATIALGEAVMDMEDAVGNKTMAEKIKGSIQNARAKGKNDQDALKVLVGDINNATDELNKMDLKAKMDKQKANASVTKALLKIGAAILLDTLAVDEAKKLTGESADAVKGIKDSPMSYGPNDLGSAQTVGANSKYVTENIPPQITGAQSLSAKLTDYAKSNGIAVPSQDEIRKLSQDMEKG